MFQGERPKTVHDAAHAMTADQPCPDPNFQKGLQLCQGGILRLFGDTGAAPPDSDRAGRGQGQLDPFEPAGRRSLPLRPRLGHGQSGDERGLQRLAGRQDLEPGGCGRLAGRRLDRHRHDELQPVRDGVRQDQADRSDAEGPDDRISAGLLPFRRPRSGLAVVGQLPGRTGHELGRRRARRGRPGQPQHCAEGTPVRRTAGPLGR